MLDSCRDGATDVAVDTTNVTFGATDVGAAAAHRAAEPAEGAHMSTRIVLTGRRVADPEPDELGELYGDELGYRVLDEVRTGRARDAVAEVVLDADPDDVVEIRDADGFVTFRRVSSLLQDERRAGRSGDSAISLRPAAARDGLGSVRSVRRLRVTLPAEVARAAGQVHDLVDDDAPPQRLLDRPVEVAAQRAMQSVLEWVEEPADPQDRRWADKPKTRGLYQVGPDLRLDRGGPVAADALEPSGEPWLLLLHGTFAHTEATFGALRGDDFARFAGRYEHRLLALEHATLGRTPAQNALEAASVLPDGARLHLLSHGRGGLVGDVLALAAAAGAWPGTQSLNGPGQDGHPDVAVLDELRRVVVGKRLRVERYARVAAPARGTTLASRRLDRWATYLLQVFRLFPALSEPGVAAVVEKLVLALLDRRSDPRLVPGVEAMMPESPFIRWLSTAPPIDDGMAVVGGEVTGGGLVQRLEALGLESFRGEGHDLVVSRRSMSGGVPRTHPREASYAGPDVLHTTYFSRSDSRGAALAWLGATGPDVGPFVPPDAPPVVASRPRERRGTTGTVVVVPDVFGSVLRSPRGRVWPSIAGLLAGVAEVLSAQESHTVEGLTGASDALVAALASRYAVRPVGYDWTRPAGETAASLAEALGEVARTTSGPLHVVGVGAGGLHLLRALADAADVRARITASAGRVVLLSPPVDGSWRVAATLKGRDELAARLALLDRHRTAEEVGAALAALPGLAWLLPAGAPFERGVLAAAAAARQDLSPPLLVTVICGSATTTVTGWSERHDTFTTTAAGDGQVHLTGAVLGSPTFWAPMSAADLVSRRDGTTHVLRVLEQGRSDGLLESVPPPAPSRGILTSSVHRVDFPSDADLVTVPAGLASRAPRVQGRAVRLSVLHGNITRTAGPVMVGTYDGTPIRGALRALDKRFAGALSARAAVAQLAGPLGTCDIIPSPQGTGTAVVIGIGDPGDLTPGQLTAAVTNALLRLILAQRERGGVGAGHGITVSAALIGTFGGGALTVQASLSAITRGVHQVNRRLLDVRREVDDAWVEALQIVELYEDRAIEAAEAANRLAKDRQPEGAVLAAEHFLREGCDGRPGLPPPAYSSGMWRTIRIGAAAEEKGSTDDLVALAFTSVGRSARAEQRINRAQRHIIDHLVDEGIDEPRTDRQLYNTLYELLVPTSMKGQGPATENLVLVVDAAASAIPFELLATRGYEEVPIPLAVETGMMRRLETTTFRETVRPAAGAHALVIGDPAGVRPRLPGAREEARRVAAKLAECGFEVTALVSESEQDMSVDVTRIMNALFEHDYRIIHIAAHGTYASESENGILIGDGILLTAHEIRQMRATPDLVFLNACHVGSVVLRHGAGERAPTNAAGRMAASVARQLIDDGVRGVVAAGWAVDDEAAASFAEHFYGHLLGAYDLGDATRLARAEIHRAFPDVNTWGAYQVYGPPAMRIHVASGSGDDTRPIVSRKQFREGIDRLKRRADNAQDDARAAVANALEDALRAVPGEWRGGAELNAEADVWFSLGEYGRAVDRYTEAMRAWEGQAPLRLFDQLINAKVKQAQQLRGAAASALFDEVQSLLEALRVFRAETPERLAVEGSYLRRRATSSEQVGWPLLEQARDAYRRAMEVHHTGTSAPGYYFGLNWAVLEWLLATKHGREPEADLLAVIDACEKDAASQACADFWCRTAVADAALARALVRRSLAEDRDAIVASYTRLFAEGSSRRDRLTIAEHVRIIGACLDEGSPARAALDEIEQELSRPLVGLG